MSLPLRALRALLLVLLAVGVAVPSTALATVDSTTEAPTLTSPGVGTRTGSPITINYALPEDGSSGTLTFTSGAATWTLALASGALTAGSHSFTIDLASPAADATTIASASPNTRIVDGSYTVTLGYRDVAANPAATASASSVLLDTVTMTPSLSSPATGSTTGATIPIHYTLPEAAFTGSITMTSAGGTWTMTLSSLGKTAGSHEFTLDPADPFTSSNGQVVAVSPSGQIPEGTYTVQLSYRDTTGNPAAASASNTNVHVDLTTGSPSLTAPAASSARRGAFAIGYALPEAGSAATLTLSGPAGTWTMALAASAYTGGAHTVTLNPADPVNGAGGRILSATPAGPIPDGSYTVTIGYRDVFDNAVATDSVAGVVLDNATIAPTLAGPAAGTYAGTIRMDYTLPEMPFPGTPTLTFASAAGSWILDLAAPVGGRFQWEMDPAHPERAPEVSSVAPSGAIPPGTYTVTLTYADALGNPIASALTTGVVISAPAPPTQNPSASSTPWAPAQTMPAAQTPRTAQATRTCSGSKRQVALCRAKARLTAALARCAARPAARRKACTAGARARYARDARAARRLR